MREQCPDTHRPSRLALGGVIALWGVMALTASSADGPPREADRWIAQLASDDWKARQQASDRLVALGEAALPRLIALADGTPDDEVRTRARAAIGQIEDDRLVGTTLVTLKLANAPATEAVAELARQARGPLVTDPPDLLKKIPRRVSLTAERRPFWQVMQSLSAQAELEVTGVTRQNREIGLGFTHGNGTEWMDRPIALAGPLLVRADRLSRVGSVALKPPRNTSEEFALSLTVFAEPKLKVLDYSASLRVEEAVDEKGNSLVPPGDPDGVAANVDVFGSHAEGHTSRWEVGATLHHPKGMGARIARLRAATTLVVATRSATLELPLAGGARNVTRTVGPLRVTAKSVDAGRAELSVHRDGRTDAEWYAVRMQLSAARAHLVDDTGRIVAREQRGGGAAGGGDDSDDDQRLDVRLRFAREAAASEATRFVWEVPTEARELVVPFEFRDLPIP